MHIYIQTEEVLLPIITIEVAKLKISYSFDPVVIIRAISSKIITAYLQS